MNDPLGQQYYYGNNTDENNDNPKEKGLGIIQLGNGSYVVHLRLQ